MIFLPGVLSHGPTPLGWWDRGTGTNNTSPATSHSPISGTSGTGGIREEQCEFQRPPNLGNRPKALSATLTFVSFYHPHELKES